MYTALDYENYIRSILNVDTPSISFREMNTGLIYHGEHSLLQARHLPLAMIIKSYTAVKYVNPNSSVCDEKYLWHNQEKSEERKNRASTFPE